MIHYLLQELNFWSSLLGAINFFADLSIFYMLYTKYKSHKKVDIDLPCGSFRIRRGDMNIGNLTNITSSNFYDGGKVPDDIRKKLIEYTAPEVYEVKKRQTRNQE